MTDWPEDFRRLESFIDAINAFETNDPDHLTDLKDDAEEAL